MGKNLQKILSNLLYVGNNYFVSKYFNRFFDDYVRNLDENLLKNLIFDDEYSTNGKQNITEEDKYNFIDKETKNFISIQLFLLKNIEDIYKKKNISIFYSLRGIGFLIGLLDFFELYINTNELWGLGGEDININIFCEDKEDKNIIKYWENKHFGNIFKEINFLKDDGYPNSRIKIKVGESDNYDIGLIDRNTNCKKFEDKLKNVSDLFLIEDNQSSGYIDYSSGETGNIFVDNPTRMNLRYFMYRYFGEKDNNGSKFDRFSEERQDSVNLLEIFDEDLKREQTIDKGNYIQEKGGQFEILSSILKGNNTLGIMSTGGGKSLMYQLSSILLPGTIIVISPLKSLMEDQYANLQNFGFENLVARIHSGLSDEEKEKQLLKVKSGLVKLLYTAPERFQSEKDVNNILSSFIDNVSIFTFDEAHCLSEWGHEFRTSYLNLGFFIDKIRREKKKIPVLALTATASPVVKEDIINYLGIERLIEESSINRTNISMEIVPVKQWNDKRKVLLDYLKSKMNLILGNVAKKEGKYFSSIFDTDEEGKFEYGGLIFTIYGPKKKKRNPASVSSTAFDLYSFLVQNLPEYKDDIMFYFSGTPDELSYKACPKCNSSNIEHKSFDPGKEYVIYCANCGNYCHKTIKNGKYPKACCGEEWTEKKGDIMYKGFSGGCNDCGEVFQSPNYIKIDNRFLGNNGSERDGEKIAKDLREKQRMTIQDSFKKNDLVALVSTKGFGMGIDKPNINFIIHYVLSSSLEQYYQEIGRAGRNKEHSHSVVLFNGPCAKCLTDTNNFDSLKNLPQCMDDKEGVKFNRCPINQEPLCDIGRQLLMIKKPIYCDEEGMFLDDILMDYDGNSFSEINVKINNKKKSIKLKDFLLEKDNLKSGFKTVLTEFWQIFIFYKDFIYSSKDSVINISSKDDFCEQKLVYRLLCMGIIEKYFLDYKSYRFKIYLSGNSPTELENNVIEFINKKVDKEFNKVNPGFLTSEEEYIINNAAGGDKNLKLFAEALYILIKKIYEKVEAGRLRQFIHLYKSIQGSINENKCFRGEILNRLLGVSEEDLGKCGFCSGCEKDAEHYKVTRGNLSLDTDLKKINSLLKRKLKGEKLSKDEDEILSNRTKKDIGMIRFRDRLDTILSNQGDENSIVDVISIFKDAKENKLNISGNVERVLDTGNSGLNVLLLDSCIKIKTQLGLATQDIDIIISNHMNLDSINTISSIVEQYGADEDFNSVVDVFYDELSEQIPLIDDKNLIEEVNSIRDQYLSKKLGNENYLKAKNLIKLFHTSK